jgi:hypothetical protein
MPEKIKKEMKKIGVKSDADLKMDKKAEAAGKMLAESAPSKMSGSRKKLSTGLGSTSEKEQEIEDLLSEEEDALGVTTDADRRKFNEEATRIEKQGMSDQGIVSPKELKEFGKDVYKGAKAGVKKVAKSAVEAAKAGVKKVKEYMD